MIGNGKSLVQSVRDGFDKVMTTFTGVTNNPSRLFLVIGTAVSLAVGTFCWATGIYPFAFLFLTVGVTFAMQILG